MMEGVSGFSGHWLEILAAVYLVGMVLYGHYRGFIRLCVSALALVISLVTVRVALPYVTEWLKNDTPVYESIRQGMADAVGLDGLLDGVLDIGAGTGGSDAGIGERRTIEELKLPEQMKRILIENNNREVYQMLGWSSLGITWADTWLIRSLKRRPRSFCLQWYLYCFILRQPGWI